MTACARAGAGRGRARAAAAGERLNTECSEESNIDAELLRVLGQLQGHTCTGVVQREPVHGMTLDDVHVRAGAGRDRARAAAAGERDADGQRRHGVEPRARPHHQRQRR